MIHAANPASTTFVRAETTSSSTASQGTAASSDAEKTAKLNAELTRRLETMRASADKFLDEKLPLKERLKNFSEFQATYNTVGNAVVAAGYERNSRGIDKSDPVQENYITEARALGDRVYKSDLYRRGEMIVNASAIPAAQSLANGNHPAEGQLAHWNSLTSDEQDIAFAMNYGISQGDGSRRFSTKEQYAANLERNIKDHEKAVAGGMVGGSSSAERLEQASRIMQTHGGDYKAWQASRGNAGAVVDKIDLSAEGAKAAAETLSQPVDDGANDDALKALETLKQVSAQQREWLKSIQEGDNDKADETGKSGVKDLSANASALSAKAINGEGTETKTPGTLVSVEA
jgi:hypothetical protein